MLLQIIGKTEYVDVNIHHTNNAHPDGVPEEKYCIVMRDPQTGSLYVNHCLRTTVFGQAAVVSDELLEVEFLVKKVIGEGEDEYGPRTIVQRPKIGGFKATAAKSAKSAKSAARMAKLLS